MEGHGRDEKWADELYKVAREMFADEQARLRDLWQRLDLLLRNLALLAAAFAWLIPRTLERVDMTRFWHPIPAVIAIVGAGILAYGAYFAALLLARPAELSAPTKPSGVLDYYDQTLKLYSGEYQASLVEHYAGASASPDSATAQPLCA